MIGSNASASSPTRRCLMGSSSRKLLDIVSRVERGSSHAFRADAEGHSIMKRLILTALVALTAASCAQASGGARTDGRAVVAIEGGSLSGSLVAGTDNVWSYKAIPFAAPPVGALRWRAPEPVVAWQGVRDATDCSRARFQAVRQEGSFYG